MVRLILPFAVVSLQAASAFTIAPKSAVTSSTFVNSQNVPQHRLGSSASTLRMAADADRPIVKPILDKVKTPADMKGLSMRDLKQVNILQVFRLVPFHRERFARILS